MTAVLTNLFDGIAYGMLLFVLACGLAVTLGLMNFINLAHGAFAMAGGYCTVILVNRFGVPFALGLPIAFLVTALLGGIFERTLYVHVYARSHLDQVLFTIGLVFMAVSAYDGMNLIYEMLKKTGGKTDGDSLIAAAKGMAWESPRGPVSIDPETRDIVQNVYIRKVEKKNGELYNVEFATFPNVKDPIKAAEAK